MSHNLPGGGKSKYSYYFLLFNQIIIIICILIQHSYFEIHFIFTASLQMHSLPWNKHLCDDGKDLKASA